MVATSNKLPLLLTMLLALLSAAHVGVAHAQATIAMPSLLALHPIQQAARHILRQTGVMSSGCAPVNMHPAGVFFTQGWHH